LHRGVIVQHVKICQYTVRDEQALKFIASKMSNL